LGCPDDTELSVSIVGDRSIRIINRNYLGRDKPTNVIAFSLQEGDCSGINPHAMGDVIVSADTAAREAENGGMEFFERLTFCFCMESSTCAATTTNGAAKLPQ
jgi:probable rRNA maturation factor